MIYFTLVVSLNRKYNVRNNEHLISLEMIYAWGHFSNIGKYLLQKLGLQRTTFFEFHEYFFFVRQIHLFSGVSL